MRRLRRRGGGRANRKQREQRDVREPAVWRRRRSCGRCRHCEIRGAPGVDSGAKSSGVRFAARGKCEVRGRADCVARVGKAALQAAQESLAYRGSKEALQLREALQLSSSEYAAEEAARRQAWLQKVPDEPPEGQAGSALICVHVGEAQHWRRFDSSEVLEDVVNL